MDDKQSPGKPHEWYLLQTYLLRPHARAVIVIVMCTTGSQLSPFPRPQ